MKKNDIIKLVKEICIKILENSNFELVDVEFVKEGPSYFLRVFIDKPGGITIDDCQEVSEALSDELDSLDPIDVSYYLEVSSPGIDRPLKTDDDLRRSIGKDIEARLYSNLKGKKKLVGKLISFDDVLIKILEDELGELEILRKDISKLNLAVRF